MYDTDFFFIHIFQNFRSIPRSKSTNSEEPNKSNNPDQVSSNDKV